jgi:hypothetical protein
MDLRGDANEMSIITWLGAVSAIITILAFLFAVWVWIWKDNKVRELEGIVQTAYDEGYSRFPPKVQANNG